MAILNKKYPKIIKKKSKKGIDKKIKLWYYI